MPTRPRGSRGRAVKNGRSRAGERTHLRRECGERFVPDAEPVAHPESLGSRIPAALEGRVGPRGARRAFGVHRDTIAGRVKKGRPS